jgi:hypothetical protein
MKIATRHKNKGTITKLRELFRYLFHILEDARLCLRESNIISTTAIAAPYRGVPTCVNIEIESEEVVLEITLDEIILEYIPLSNIKTPCECNDI